MGVFDPCCAICGGPFKVPLEHFTSVSTTRDPTCWTATLEKELDWLSRLRVIGRNLSTGKAYITGVGSSIGFGATLVERGDDPNVPLSGQVQLRDDGMIELPAYFEWSAMGDGDADVVPFPVHCECIVLLRKACSVSRRADEILDWDTVLEGVRTAMQKLVGHATGCLGKVDYFEFQQSLGEDLWEEMDETRARLVRQNLVPVGLRD
jgi:hypothetical protein